MKASVTNVFVLLFIIATQLLFSSTTTIRAAATEDIVKDSRGKNVLDNVPYHIGPPIPAKVRGRIKLTDTMNNKKVCPFNVVQDTLDVNFGGQFTFTLIGNFEDNYLHTSSILGIDSGYPKGACEKSTFWTIPDAEAEPPSNLITTGGGFDDSNTCFQVVQYRKPTGRAMPTYMLQHCPWFCGAGPQTCFNISIYVDNGVRRLSSTGGTPFEFAFYQVQKSLDIM